MKTFDYEKAWLELAKPAFLKLPGNVLHLIEHSLIEADNLAQDSRCQMVWPDDGVKLRDMFEAIPSTELSHAANVVHDYSHWRPSASVAGDAPACVAGWKFSNYADQVLRARFNIALDGKAQVSLQIHEGKIRVCYSSRDMWTWHEVAQADDAGMKVASDLAVELRQKLGSKRRLNDQDSIAYKFMEELKTQFPGDTAAFMVEESELELRRAERMPKPDKAKLIASINAAFDSKVKNLTTERDGELWLVNHDMPKDNCIYYDHTGRFCFGWRKPYTGDSRLELLNKLTKFPFPYDVK